MKVVVNRVLRMVERKDLCSIMRVFFEGGWVMFGFVEVLWVVLVWGVGFGLLGG